MTEEDVQERLGKPPRVRKNKDPESKAETWIYERMIFGSRAISTTGSSSGKVDVAQHLILTERVTIEFSEGLLESVDIKTRRRRVHAGSHLDR
ncbi:MAG: hypothetical protein P8L44_21865 [Opitutales bacterium]|nr:hypothetical protein [Opitutales bacterium]